MTGHHSHTRRHRLLPAMICGVVALWCCGVPAFGQVKNLDKGRMIDALQREGMSELLLHMVEVEPPTDPVEAQLIKIAQLQLRYRDDDDRLSDDEQLTAFDELVQSYGELIQQHNTHEQRPIWQTDLAEILIYSYLQGTRLNASEFYDLGVPSIEQRDAFEKMAQLALENLSDADQRFFVLQSELPRGDEAAHRQRINSGLWARMMEDYYGFRTQFFLGQAAYYVSLLPDSHEYFRGLGKNERVPFQAKNAKDEKTRLLDMAITKMQPLVEDPSDKRQVRLISQTFQARARTLKGLYADATRQVDEVINANKGDLTHLVANLVKGRAMSGNKQGLQALDHLTRIEFHPLAQQSLYMRLLVVDQEHQILLKLTPDSAYDPYITLLADRNIPEEQREGLRLLIYNRWAASIPDSADLNKQPPLVLAAIGELARIEGQDLFNQAYLAQQDNREADAAELFKQAAAKFDRAIRVLDKLLSRSNLDPKIAAKGLLNLAYARYFKAPEDPQTLLAAAKLWTDMAEKTPEAPEAVEALGNAEGALRPWFENPQKPPGIREAYLRTTEMLFKQHPQSSQANDARLYYGFAVLLPAGKYAEAAAMFQDVPQGHPTYYDARREWVLALQQAYETAKPADKPAARKAAMDAAEFVLEEANRALGTALPADAPVLRETIGWATIAKFDLMVSEGKIDQALKLVEGFETTYEDNPPLLDTLLERKIVVLAKADRHQELEKEANQMMLLNPNSAAPVISGVLDKLEREIDQLRAQATKEQVEATKQELLTQAAGRASTASTLAGLLLKWAGNRGFSADERLPFEMINVKALRLAGRAGEALKQIEPIALKDENRDNGTVVQEYAETLFAAGLEGGRVKDRTMLVKASEQYKNIIFGFSQGPFPAAFWNAWMRWMQIADAVGEGTEGIAAKVKELAAFDPNLGGDPYRSELRRLELKYAGATRK